MKLRLALVCSLLGIMPTYAEDQEIKITEAELRALEGEYTFNPSDTDEMAVVQVKFRRPTEREGGGKDEWRADGKLDNSFHGTVVNFKGAYVYKDGEEVVVSAQFFGFKLKKGVLNWVPNYDRQLYLKKKEAAEKAAPSGGGKPSK